MNKKTFAVIFLGLALGLSACSLSLAQDITPPPGYQPPVFEDSVDLTGVYPQTAPDAANGAAIYAEKCQACHGPTGLGDGPQALELPEGVQVGPIGVAESASQATPAEWFSIISQGNIDNFMPPFSQSLSDQNIWDVVAYIYSFTSPPEALAEGEEIYAATCAPCHGEAGASPLVPGAADLGDPEIMAALSIETIVQKAATGGANDEHVFSGVLDTDQLQSVAVYLRSLVFGVREPDLFAGVGAEAPTDEAGGDQPAGEEPSAGDQEPPVGDAAPEGEIPADGVPPGEAAPALGTVSGTVTNASSGETPEGLAVTLRGFDHFEELLSLTTEVGPDGGFLFEDVDLQPELVFFVEAEFQNSYYGSDFYVVKEGDTSLDLSFDVYETTTDTSALVIDRVHVFFNYPSPEVVQVITQVSVSNQGTSTVISEREIEPNLRFILPEGATNLIFEQGAIGQPYVTTADGFGDPSPVRPGESAYQILYAYELPYSRTMEWAQGVTLPADLVVVFVPGEGLKIESDTLEANGTETFEGITYQVFSGTDFEAGDRFGLTLSGRSPAAGTDFSLQGDTFTTLIGLAGLALAAVGVWSWFRPKKRVDYAGSADALIDEIIALDEAFEAGELGEAEYQNRRAKLKRKLSALVEDE